MQFSLLVYLFLSSFQLVLGNSFLPDKNVCLGGSPTKSSVQSSTSQSCLDVALKLKGGEVFEPASLADVDSIIMKASNEGKLVVIDFSATWCGPCKMISPLYHELSDEFTNIVFLKVDVDENPETAVKYQVSAMPTFLFIKRGEVVDKLMGANPAALKQMLEDLA